MKKIIIANCAALFAFGICELSAFDYNSGSATETAEATEESNWFFGSNDKESVASPDKKAFKESADVCEYEKTGKEALENFYVAAGLCYSNERADSTFMGDNMGDFERAMIARPSFVKTGASLAFGWGAFATGNFYAGAEFLLDLIGGKTSIGAKLDYVSEIKSNAVVPTIALRLGGYSDPMNTLFFAKIGMARVSSNYKMVDIEGLTKDGFKVCRMTPVVGLGAETKIGAIGLRVDYDYRFKADRDDCLMSNQGYGFMINQKVKGYVVRVMATYNLPN